MHVMAVLSEDTPGPPAPSANNSGVQSPMDDPKMPQDPLLKKLRDTVNARLKNDAIVCSTAAIVVFLVHQSDVFVQAFPNLDIVLWSVTICVGFALPHLQKQTPCVSRLWSRCGKRPTGLLQAGCQCLSGSVLPFFLNFTNQDSEPILSGPRPARVANKHCAPGNW